MRKISAALSRGLWNQPASRTKTQRYSHAHVRAHAPLWSADEWSRRTGKWQLPTELAPFFLHSFATTTPLPTLTQKCSGSPPPLSPESEESERVMWAPCRSKGTRWPRSLEKLTSGWEESRKQENSSKKTKESIDFKHKDSNWIWIFIYLFAFIFVFFPPLFVRFFSFFFG